ncbi:FecR family protein [Parapedobacter sp. 10938]|uniref:FecR family protein n=1 Tax=Parapedobacter flavus TaxID=3110225 RepID=UPI002DBC2026|nr:FecR domain-containing protein [Parapedobacter sp. 10938]MEC3881647.1 FecR domain-containing protein [Parapedobacter sp. 10938]
MSEDISSLILKMLQENITPEEINRLETWTAADPANRKLLDQFLDQEAVIADTKAFDELWGGENGTTRFDRMEQAVRAKTSMPVKKLSRRWLRYVAAAIVLPLIVTAWLMFDLRMGPSDGTAPTISQTADIQPGGNRAELTLPGGQTVVLDEWQRGILVGDTLKYTDGSAVLSASADDASRGKLSPMVISVPHGGQYQVTLSDGTMIWLNAASTLRYPAKFSAEERVVEFEGEGYFVVAHDSDRPFKIINQRQTIEVLGTEFNLSAYPEEPLVRTTLVDGNVTVSYGDPAIRPLHLSPGQQAVVDGSSGHVETVDTAPFTAWKDGFFYFDGDSPESAFAQLGRWYNIEVVYPHHVPNVQFYGKLERNKSLGAILKILEKAGLVFQVVPQDERYQLIIGGKTKT